MQIKKYLKPFRNKYILVGSLFAIYAVFLDDVDVFMIYSKHRKLNQLEIEKAEMETKLYEIAEMQSILTDRESLEKFAREERLFRKPNEDIYIISEE
jgi:cell division protein FtsB